MQPNNHLPGYFHLPFVEQWGAAGYDVEAAAARHSTFLQDWRAAPSASEADQMVAAFFSAEIQIALSQGVAADDINLDYLRAAPKYYES